jgi:hypothetical protein
MCMACFGSAPLSMPFHTYVSLHILYAYSQPIPNDSQNQCTPIPRIGVYLLCQVHEVAGLMGSMLVQAVPVLLYVLLGPVT